jgi:hypothetical protein
VAGRFKCAPRALAGMSYSVIRGGLRVNDGSNRPTASCEPRGPGSAQRAIDGACRSNRRRTGLEPVSPRQGRQNGCLTPHNAQTVELFANERALIGLRRCLSLRRGVETIGWPCASVIRGASGRATASAPPPGGTESPSGQASTDTRSKRQRGVRASSRRSQTRPAFPLSRRSQTRPAFPLGPIALLATGYVPPASSHPVLQACAQSPPAK